MKRFEDMTIAELSAEMDRFYKQMMNQGYPMTNKQRIRWIALKKQYQTKNKDIAK